jgi:hypothetical protein
LLADRGENLSDADLASGVFENGITPPLSV